MDSDSSSTCSRSSSPDLERIRTATLGRAKAHVQLSKEDLQELRLRVNSRERKRMHVLNQAMDGLREVMPYAQGPSVRKLSKISTLLLARNYILMLSSSLEEMRKLVGDMYGTGHQGPVASVLLLHHPLAQSLHSLTAGAPSAVAPGSPTAISYPTLQPTVHVGGLYAHYPRVACPCSLCQSTPASMPAPQSLSMGK